MVCTLGVPRLRAQTYLFGTASYAAPELAGVGGSPPSGAPPVAVADFNHDGIPDLAILGLTAAGVNGTPVLAVYLGRPNGTLAPPVDYAVSGSSLAVGDFNGDGKLDIVAVGGNSAPYASILLGNGDGTFQAPTPLTPSVAGTYTAVAAADLNGDGKLDLVLATQDFGPGATIAVLLGNGDGTFQAPVTYPVAGTPYLALGDFNGDGRPDIAVGGQSTISVLINNGDGSFQSPVSYTVSGTISALATADLNGDGDLDLIAASSGSAGGISTLLGKGNGAFAAPVLYSSTQLDVYGMQLSVADFNGDGKLDLALTNQNANQVDVLLGNGDGTFQNPPRVYSGGLEPTAIRALDANGDGRPDLAVVGGYSPFYLLSVLINRGDGSFPVRSTDPVLSSPASLVSADFNGDGRPDIASASDTASGGISTLLSNADGTFQAHLDSAFGPSGNVGLVNAMAAGDFNQDGVPDLVVADEEQNAAGATEPELATLLGNGDGTFRNTANQIVPAGIESLATADFNGNGIPGLAATTQGSSDVSIFPGNGDGTFGAPTQAIAGPMANSPPYHTVLAGDFNGDGNADLAVATDNGVAILLGNGGDTFQAPALIPSLYAPDPGDDLLALADVNGDGKLDVVKSTQTNIVNVALGQGDGTFTNAAGLQLPSILDAQSAVVGDFNGDGKPDLALVSQSSDVMTVLLGNGDGTFCCAYEFDAGSISGGEQFMAAADFSGDGGLDAAFANFSSATVSVFLNSPVAAFAPRAVNFGSEAIGATSAAQTVALSNPGSAPMAISAIAASGGFAQSNNCPAQLPVAGSCQIQVTFAPTASGAVTGTLTFSDSASLAPQALVLSGTGAGAPAVKLSSTALSFPSQAVGSTSTAQTLTVTNDGSAPLTFASGAVTLSGANAADFALASDGCSGQTVAPGGSCAVSVTFDPPTGGDFSAVVDFADNAGGSPQSATLSGAAPDFTIGPASGAATSATVSPGGTATYSLGVAALGGFNQAVALTCTGAPALAACAVSPTSVTPNGSGPSAVTVTVTTTAASLLAPAPPASRPPALPFDWELLAAALALLLATATRRREARQRSLPRRARLAALLLAAVALAACGGGGSGGGGGGAKSSPGTPSGSYTLTVKGSAGSVSHSTTLKLTVN